LNVQDLSLQLKLCKNLLVSVVVYVYLIDM